MPRLPKSPFKPEPASPPPASLSSHARLPVNPRRKKVAPDERKRVATACNSCNQRRIKCNGQKPCEQCANATRECLYPEPIPKKTIPEAEYDELVLISKWAIEAYTEKFGQPFTSDLSPDQRTRAEALLNERFRALSLNANANASRRAAQSSAEPMEVDEGTDSGSMPPERQPRRTNVIDDGNGKLEDDSGTTRYLGKTSGATFLNGVREFMCMTYAALAHPHSLNPLDFDSKFFNSNSLGRYHTFDSRGLPVPDNVDPLWLPPRVERDRMLTKLRNCLQEGPPPPPGMTTDEDQLEDKTSGGIFFWPLENADSLESSWNETERLIARRTAPKQPYRWLAKYQAAFALATLLSHTKPGTRVDGGEHDIFFERASKLLGSPLDINNQFMLEDVPAMTLMAMYLLENNRRDKAHQYVSTAMAVCVEHGAHSVTSTNPPLQSQLRAFLTLYLLDRWLSCLMGRPPSCPKDMDSRILKARLSERSSGLPSSHGLLAHVELSEISTYIVQSDCKASTSVDETPAFVKTAHGKLQKWKEGLPDSLKLPESTVFKSYGLLDSVPRFECDDRAVCMLHMAHNQLYILTVRPMFLVIVRKKVAKALKGVIDDDVFPSGTTDTEAERREMLKHCGELARQTISLALTVRDLPDHQVLVQDLHHTFNAACILMLNQLYNVNLWSGDTARITEAINMFEKEAKTGNAYCIDCAGVLKDLRKLVDQLRPAIFEGSGIQNAPELLLAPGEGILASLTQTSMGSGTEMEVDQPAFPRQSHGLTNPSPGSTNRGSPGQGSASPALETLAKVSKTLERWETTDVAGLYRDGNYMVDSMVGRVG